MLQKTKSSQEGKTCEDSYQACSEKALALAQEEYEQKFYWEAFDSSWEAARFASAQLHVSCGLPNPNVSRSTPYGRNLSNNDLVASLLSTLPEGHPMRCFADEAHVGFYGLWRTVLLMGGCHTESFYDTHGCFVIDF